MSLIGPRRALLVGTPGWVLPGSSVDMNFAHSQAWSSGQIAPITSLLTMVRASTGYAQTSSGLLVQFAANAPRITDQGLLVEEARTNLALQSQTFDLTWASGHAGVGTDAVVTANAGAAPDGTTTADRVQLALNGGTSTTDQSFIGQLITVSNTTAYAATVYLKSNTASSYAVQLVDSSGSGIASITVTPSWQRFTLLETTAGTTFGFRIRLRGGQTPTNAGSADILAWGAQLEAGAFATSPIPTTTVAVTRAADNITLASAAATAALNSASMFAQSNATNASTTGRFAHFSGGAFMEVLSSSQVQINNNSAQSTLATIGSGTTSGPLKVAFGYDASSITAIANGGSLGTQPNAWAGTGTVYVGSNNGASAINGYLQRLAFSAAKGQFDGRTQ